MTTAPESEFELIKPKLARSLKEVLTAEARTPEGERTLPCDVYISLPQLVYCDDEPMTATAAVTYVTYSPKERKHTAHIKFKYVKTGKFLRETMTYV